MALPILRRGGNTVPTTRDNFTPIGRTELWNDFDYMDRVFDSFFRAPFSMLERSRTASQSDSQIELYETSEELIAVAFVPGINKDTLNVSATGNTLVVQGERKPRFESQDGLTAHTPWTSAVSSGSFNVEYALPVEIDAGKVQATYVDGVLEIHLPKAETVKPKQIKVDIKGS